MPLVPVVLCGLLLAVLLAPVAYADTRLDRAQRIAENVWSDFDYCPDGTTVRFDVEKPEEIEEAFPLAWAAVDTCTIEFKQPASKLQWYELCDGMIHETGHLAGVGHSENPRSVMYAGKVYTEDTFLLQVPGRTSRVFRVGGADRRCYDRGRRYLGMRPAGFGWR